MQRQFEINRVEMDAAGKTILREDTEPLPISVLQYSPDGTILGMLYW